MTSISFLHLVIAGTQLVCCEFCFFPAPPQKVVVLLPTFLQSDLFQLRISEFSVNKNQKQLCALGVALSHIRLAIVYKLLFS